MRLPSSRGTDPIIGGFVSGPARQPNYSGRSVAAFSDLCYRCKIESPTARGVNRFTAFSFEFVAKPAEAANAVLDLPAAIPSALEGFAGFAGSLVMVSDLEARLITVIILWQGSEARRSCAGGREPGERAACSLPGPLLARSLPTPQALSSGSSSIDTSFITGESMAQEANAR